MRHGYGTYTFPSGAKYEGCWFMGFVSLLPPPPPRPLSRALPPPPSSLGCVPPRPRQAVPGTCILSVWLFLHTPSLFRVLVLSRPGPVCLYPLPRACDAGGESAGGCVGHLLTAMPWACDVRGGRKRHGQALEQSKKGCHKVDFDNNKRTDQTEFIPGADNEFDMLIAKVRAAVDKVLPSSMPSLFAHLHLHIHLLPVLCISRSQILPEPPCRQSACGPADCDHPLHRAGTSRRRPGCKYLRAALSGEAAHVTQAGGFGDTARRSSKRDSCREILLPARRRSPVYSVSRDSKFGCTRTEGRGILFPFRVFLLFLFIIIRHSLRFQII